MLPLLGLMAAGIIAKGVQGAMQKDASDYQNETTRHDMNATDEVVVPGRTDVYTRYSPERDMRYRLVDRGSNADTFSALNDPNSQASRSFSLGGSPEAAAAWANSYQNQAEAARNIRGSRIDYGADDAVAAQQLGLGGMYRAQMMGSGPSVADLQASAANQVNIRNALAAGIGNPRNQRAAMLGAAMTGSDLAARAGAMRSQETLQAGQKLGSLQGQMSQMGMDRAMAQAKLDSQMADFNDSLANKYYGLQQTALDAQTRGQRARGLAMQLADRGRKDENFGEAQGAADRHNRDVNTVLGGISSAAGGLASVASAGSGGSKK
jgi:hypothetical protein